MEDNVWRDWVTDFDVLSISDEPVSKVLAALRLLSREWTVLVSQSPTEEKWFYHVSRREELVEKLYPAQERNIRHLLGQLNEWTRVVSVENLSTVKPQEFSDPQGIGDAQLIIALNDRHEVLGIGQVLGQRTGKFHEPIQEKLSRVRPPRSVIDYDVADESQEPPSAFDAPEVRTGTWSTPDGFAAAPAPARATPPAPEDMVPEMSATEIMSKGPSTQQILKRVRPPETVERSVVEVLYATDRKRKEDYEWYYIGERCEDGELAYGKCTVSIPPTHRMGKLEKPRWWKLEFRPDPDKHIVLVDVDSWSSATFFSFVRRQLEEDSAQSALIFVHGFNVSFADAAQRTAQLAYDLQFEGVPIFYSWPSCANVEGYLADEATVEWTKPHLKKLLQDLAANGVSNIHVIAHSMGNRALARAISELSTSSSVRLNQIILTAPDIDTGEFLQLADAIRSVSQRVTLYASSTDKAIQISRTIHKYPRAGEAGKQIVVTKGIDTIDATGVDTSFLAHSYFSDEQRLLADIYYVIREGKPPSKRHGLTWKLSLRGVYWAFRS